MQFFNWQLKYETEASSLEEAMSVNLETALQTRKSAWPSVDLWGIEPATCLTLNQDLSGTVTVKLYSLHLLFPDFYKKFSTKM